MFSWSGGKGSVLGGSSLYGPRGLDFFTQLKVSNFFPSLAYDSRLTEFAVAMGVKTTTAYWRAEDALDTRASTAMPTHN